MTAAERAALDAMVEWRVRRHQLTALSKSGQSQTKPYAEERDAFQRSLEKLGFAADLVIEERAKPTTAVEPDVVIPPKR